MSCPRTQQSMTAAEREAAARNKRRAQEGEGRIATSEDARGRPWVKPGVTLLDGGQGRGPVVQA